MNPLQANLHTHADFCDGTQSLEEMIEAAIENDYITLGFSSHSPLPFANDYAMTPKAERAYLDAMDDMKERYREEIELLTGLEWDLDTPEGFVPFERYDYIIGSVHQLHRGGTDYAVDESRESLERCIEEGFSGDASAMVEAYYKAVVKNALRPRVDIVGHVDLLRKYNDTDAYFDETDASYRDVALSAVKEIVAARPDVVFEVNFGGMKRAGLLTPYPDRFLMEALCRLGAKITLQADAHAATALSEGWQEAITYAKDAGFTHAYRLRQDAIWEKVRL